MAAFCSRFTAGGMDGSADACHRVRWRAECRSGYCGIQSWIRAGFGGICIDFATVFHPRGCALQTKRGLGDGLCCPVACFRPVQNGCCFWSLCRVQTALFKCVQGSSMATFAAIGPVAAPVVLSSGVDAVAAVFAICLGSFIAILPNDSYYWLVRQDALQGERSERRAIFILAGGAIVQALAGLTLLMIVVTLWN